MKSLLSLNSASLLGLLALVTAVGSVPARASSHQDAPLITLDPAANTTDVYAFVVQRNGVKYLDVALGVYPHEEPGVGPNKYGFDANVLYQIFLADPTTGADRVAYQFQFSDSFKSQATILQGYLGVIAANGDASQNFTQTYTVTKVVGGVSTVLGTGTVPPNNQGVATPKYNKGDNGLNQAKDGVADATALDDYTRGAVATLNNGYRSFSGQRDDAFYGDINSIFDLVALRSGANNRFDSQGGFNIHLIALEIPLADIAGGESQTVGVYATTSRRATTVLTDGAGSAGTTATGAWVQVGRQGNPLFCEAFIALKDKDLYNRTKPTSDATLFKTYAENTELGALINALLLKSKVAIETGRTDLAAIFIPDVIKIDLSTARARLPGGGATNSVLADDAGYSRLSIFGGDVLESPTAGHPFRLPGSAIGADATKFYVPGGWPNGRRIGEDVIDIGVSAILSDLRTLPLKISVADGIDNVSSNDMIFNKVFPYSATPHNGHNSDHNPRQVTSPLLNISARGVAGGGGNSLIGGFVIRGNLPVSVLVRAQGASLTALGVPDALADTTLEVWQGGALVQSNDNWKTPAAGGATQAAITATGYAPGSDSDSAILVTLQPGAYTTVVRGKNGATGVAIIEAFLTQ
ncbi:MAG: DUF4331 domain-containing protein [Verrucomicrobia bacterium]|nr:DUF4331 domain-containing protein [Verrucomicrobiota bacterium]